MADGQITGHTAGQNLVPMQKSASGMSFTLLLKFYIGSYEKRVCLGCQSYDFYNGSHWICADVIQMTFYNT